MEVWAAILIVACYSRFACDAATVDHDPKRFEAFISGQAIPENQVQANGSRAEVRLLVPAKPRVHIDTTSDVHVAASSVVMEYNEDTRKYLLPAESEIKEGSSHRRRHQLSRSQGLRRRRPRLRSLLIGGGRRRGILRKIEGDDPWQRPRGNSSWIALHSPTRIYLPVRYGGKDVSEDEPCVRCSGNLTAIAQRGDRQAEMPFPTVSICPRLAYKPGLINIGVTSGPRPGALLAEGKYDMKLILWKVGGPVYSCNYTVSVTVHRCPAVSPPKNSTVNCSSDDLWGSRCRFVCASGYKLVGRRTIVCESRDGRVMWSDPVPFCKKAASKKKRKRVSCPKPKQPLDGTVLCDKNDAEFHPAGSVCQLFCYPGFSPVAESNGMLTVCRNGKWSPRLAVSCIATFCSVPKKPNFGEVKCDGTAEATGSRISNATECQFVCQAGHVIPTSQLKFESISCRSPSWNSTAVPECKRAVPPRYQPSDCRNRTILVDAGRQLTMDKYRPPRFTTYGGRSLTPSCSLHGKELPKGTYLNVCNATDPELRTSSLCKYYVHVRERTCPPPPKSENAEIRCDSVAGSYPPKTRCKYTCKDGYVIPFRQRAWRIKQCLPSLRWKPSGIPSCIRAMPPEPRKHECKQQTYFMKPNETNVRLRLPKFRSSMKGSRVRVTCALNDTLTLGNHTNTCEAVDTKLQLRSSCKYQITVQVQGCQNPSSIAFGSVRCSVVGGYHLGTSCTYECNEGYVIATSELDKATTFCTSLGTWNDTSLPTCKAAHLPRPKEGSCMNVAVSIEDLTNYTIPVPEFSPQNSIVECYPDRIDTHGDYNVTCTAHDPELRTTASCTFRLELFNPSTDEIEMNLPTVVQCSDQVYTVEDVTQFEIEPPRWTSPQNTTLAVTCNPMHLSNYGVHNILCTTPDELISCSFNVTIITGLESTSESSDVRESEETEDQIEVTKLGISSEQTTAIDNEITTEITPENKGGEIEEHTEVTELEILSHLTTEDITTTENARTTVSVPETSPSKKLCEIPVAPEEGYISCDIENDVQVCNVSCRQSYGFSSEFAFAEDGRIVCNSSSGLWNFQRNHEENQLPECLAHLPTTSVEVWLSFMVTVGDCSQFLLSQDIIREALVEMNKDACRLVDCNISLAFHCADGQLLVNWTLQSAFDPDEYAASNDVSPAETNLEVVLENMRNAVTSGKTFLDAPFIVDSFVKGRFILVCLEPGFVVDMRTDRCVACPKGSIEENGSCKPCLKPTC